MLLIKTYIDNSKIHGIGLFADQLIRKGQAVWKENPLIDVRFPSLQKLNLSKEAGKQIKSFSWFNKEKNVWTLPGDNARFMNHSTHPNCGLNEKEVVVAKRLILPGEELTEDYRTFHTGSI